MKKIFLVFVMALSLIGCKSTTITPESAYRIGSSSGLAAAYVVKLSNIDNNVKSAITAITVELANVVPTNTQTFAEVWMPIVSNKIAEYSLKQGFTSNQKTVLNTTFNVVVDALDYMLMRNANLKNNIENTLSAVNGFCISFNSVMVNQNTLAASRTLHDVDSEMYMYLKTKFAK